MQINHRDSKRVDARPLKSSTTPRYNNVDRKVVEGFGNEWHRFDQSVLPLSDAINLFKDYFRIFPWDNLPEGNVVIKFYANDTLGRIGFQEVTVVSDN